MRTIYHSTHRILMISLVFTVIFLPIVGFSIDRNKGRIAGKITDMKTGKEICGAYVVLYQDTVMTGIGAASDLDGFYLQLNIPPGVYDVKIHALFYKSVTIPEIAINAGITTKLNAQLEPDTTKPRTVIYSPPSIEVPILK